MNNKTLSTSALACIIAATTLLTGCASLPKTDLASSNREKLHSIAMLDVTEPRGESVVNFGGAAGAFGLIGGLVQGGINANHTSTYTQHVASEKITFAPVVNDGLTTRLSSNGYEIVALHDQHAKLSSDGKSDDFSDVKTSADAILSVWITSFGYVSPPESSDFIPWVVVRARLRLGYQGQLCSRRSGRSISLWQFRHLDRPVRSVGHRPQGLRAGSCRRNWTGSDEAAVRVATSTAVLGIPEPSHVDWVARGR
jgi:hypothetical protein